MKIIRHRSTRGFIAFCLVFAVIISFNLPFITPSNTGVSPVAVVDAPSTADGYHYTLSSQGGFWTAAKRCVIDSASSSNNYIYFLSPTSLDVYDSSARTYVGGTNLPCSSASDVFVYYPFAFVVDSSTDPLLGGLYILSIANPNSISITSHLFVGSGGAVGVCASKDLGGIVYVICNPASGPNFFAVDATNPASPTVSGSTTTAGIPERCDSGTTEARVYVADGTAGVTFVNVANPFAPAVLGSFSSTPCHDVLNVAPDLTYVYTDGYIYALRGDRSIISWQYVTTNGQAFSLARNTGSYSYVATGLESSYNWFKVSSTGGVVAKLALDYRHYAVDVVTSREILNWGGSGADIIYYLQENGFCAIFSFVADMEPPVVQITTPQPSALVSIPTLVLTVTDNHPMGTYVSVGGSEMPLTSSSTDGYTRTYLLDDTHGDWITWQSLCSERPDGPMTITVRARDWGYLDGYAQVTVIKDSTPPSISISMPTTGSCYGPSYGAPIVTVTATDAALVPTSVYCSISGFASFYQLDEIGADIYTLNLESGAWGDWSSCWMDGMASGLYTITMSAMDEFYNQGTATVEVEWDATAPIITVLEPDFASGSPAYGTGSAVPTFRIKVEDPHLDTSSVFMNFEGASFALAVYPNNAGEFRLSEAFGDWYGPNGWDTFWQNLMTASPYGVYPVSFTAHDIFGNTVSDGDITPSPPLYLVIDQIGPKTIIHSPSSGAWFSNTFLPEYEVEASDGETLITSMYYSFDSNPQWGSGFWFPIPVLLPDYSVLVSGQIPFGVWSKCREGANFLTFCAIDSAGNPNLESVTINRDSVEPRFIIFSPQDYAEFYEIAPSYVLDVIELNFGSAWISADGWATRYLLPGIEGSLPQDFWNSLLYDELLSISIEVKDLAGNSYQQDIHLYRRDSLPVFSIVSPHESCFGPNAPAYELTFLRWALVARLWVTTDSAATEFDLDGVQGQLPQDLWDICLNGTNILCFHALSAYGRLYEVDLMLEIDKQGPWISILQPVTGDTAADIPPLYVLQVRDSYLAHIWFTLDGGKSFTEVPLESQAGAIPEDVWAAAYNKTITFCVVAEDIWGNTNSLQVVITRSDYLNPDRDTKDIGFGLFFGMTWPVMVYLATIFGGIFITLIIRHKRTIRNPKW